MNKLIHVIGLVVFLCSAPIKLHAEEGSLAQRLPRIPPREPARALESFDVQPGFCLEQVAAEPLVRDPVAMAFDENGRLYVVEMCDYSEQDRDFLGTVRLLEDTDGDGRFDKSTVFADRLSWPTAVACYDGGVFVGAAPDILYCKDTDGDGRANEKRVVFTGFHRDNVQGLLNSFQWGLDNRIYGATSMAGGKIACPDRPEQPAIDCRGRDFSFDPQTLDFRTESGGAQHGLSFDDWGRRFVCSNADHLQLILYDNRYAGRNRQFGMPPPRLSIAADGPQAAVFRISPVEPWRIVRTQWRKEGKAQGPIEGGGQPAGYFSGATGVTIYRGDAFPTEYRGQAFVADVGSNIVHRKLLEPHGVLLSGKRIDQRREFIASSDIWFRPVQLANAPDGTLYLCDMYREVIEHPESIPPEIKKHLDLTSGRDRGRIYRIVPEGYQQRPAVRLGSANAAELVRTLEHRNGWHRDTAARLLYQRQDPIAVADLMKLAGESALPEARIHALYALQGLKALSAEAVLARLGDPHPRVREHAVRLAEQFVNESAALRGRLCSMTDDSDARVRFQLAFTLGELPAGQRSGPLSKLAAGDLDDHWIRAAIFSSLSEGAARVLAEVAGDSAVCNTPAGRSLVQELARQVAIQARPEELAQIERTLVEIETASPLCAKAIVLGLAKGSARANRNRSANQPALPPFADEALQRLLAAARTTAEDENSSADDRAEAIRTLGLAKYDDVSSVFPVLLNTRHSQRIQSTTIETLGEFANDEIADVLIDAWPGLTPRLRSTASDVLFSRAKWLLALFDAVDVGKILLAEIDPARLTFLERHPDQPVRRRAAKLVAKLQIGRRDDVVRQYQAALKNLKGDPQRGREVFKKNCAACHRLEGVGHEVGPSLAAFKNRGADAICLNVLDPNREVLPQYHNWIFVTGDGVQHTGMIKAEGEDNITLTRDENVVEQVLRADIETQVNTSRSLMPEGMEKQINPQQMADLIAYILAQQ